MLTQVYWSMMLFHVKLYVPSKNVVDCEGICNKKVVKDFMRLIKIYARLVKNSILYKVYIVDIFTVFEGVCSMKSLLRNLPWE